MAKLSTSKVAKLLGLSPGTLGRYIKAGKIIAPKEIWDGDFHMRLWTETEIERLRCLLPHIADGRRTRSLKRRSKLKPKTNQ